MGARIIHGYERLAMDLEQHIKSHKPSNWTVPIHDVAATPMLSPAEAETFMKAHKSGNLKVTLDELTKQSDSPYRRIEPWYIKEAIIDFFENMLYSGYEYELQP